MRCRKCAVILSAAISLLWSSPARAQNTATYTYTGNSLDTVFVDNCTFYDPTNMCMVGSSITVTLTFASPLPPNKYGAEAYDTLISSMISDGITTIANPFVDLTTDSKGNIVEWVIGGVDGPCSASSGLDCTSTNLGTEFQGANAVSDNEDDSIIFYNGNVILYDTNSNNPGTWAGASSSCPSMDVFHYPGGNPSYSGQPTAMIAGFSPATTDGVPMSLSLAAAACGFVEFDWQQTITHLPPCVVTSVCLASNNGPLVTPFFDPPQSGYTYFSYALFPGQFDAYIGAFPFFYNPSAVLTGCAEWVGEDCATQITSIDDDTLNFFDSPETYFLPAQEYMAFTTQLVGVKPDTTAAVIPNAKWSWISTYSPFPCAPCGGFGGVDETASSQPVNGRGTGGVTITSINGVTQTPSKVTCTATPASLWPPNGKSVSVTVSGRITPGTSALTATTYAVIDEYGQDQPSGSITLGAGGIYSFAVPLIAARNGDDMNGRTYTINVTGSDKIGNVGACSAVVTVPHDQGNN